MSPNLKMRTTSVALVFLFVAYFASVNAELSIWRIGPNGRVNSCETSFLRLENGGTETININNYQVHDSSYNANTGTGNIFTLPSFTMEEGTLQTVCSTTTGIFQGMFTFSDTETITFLSPTGVTILTVTLPGSLPYNVIYESIGYPWFQGGVTWSVRVAGPTIAPSTSPTRAPTSSPTKGPTNAPSVPPTKEPTNAPSVPPTKGPTTSPSQSPTTSPTKNPTTPPPSDPPTENPTISPSASPTENPTISPSASPTENPTISPSASPTKNPTISPSASPTKTPTEISDTLGPTMMPTAAPTSTTTMKGQINAKKIYLDAYTEIYKATLVNTFIGNESAIKNMLNFKTFLLEIMCEGNTDGFCAKDGDPAQYIYALDANFVVQLKNIDTGVAYDNLASDLENSLAYDVEGSADAAFPVELVMTLTTANENEKTQFEAAIVALNADFQENAVTIEGEELTEVVAEAPAASAEEDDEESDTQTALIAAGAAAGGLLVIGAAYYWSTVVRNRSRFNTPTMNALFSEKLF